ncbi:uncharacterized protein L201_008043 [Kwoniella dendrophila CBS 6074]|uniref:ABC1 atypical kinase-like domain-containing protein n=1 Tax=Kwoniella dendrophila CBS 6074 TaxID=1295534 RepID=A0AAX4K7M0_9TREE
MLSAVIRVVARSAAIQLEEVAALSAVGSVQAQNQSQERTEVRDVEPNTVQPDYDSLNLSELLEQHESTLHPISTSPSSSSSSPAPLEKKKVLSALDRLIQQSPRSPPPPAPDTHPDRFIEAEQRKQKGLPPIENPLPHHRSSASSAVQKSRASKQYSKPTKDSIGPTLNDLIKAAPHQNPPPAPATHPDRHIEAEQSRKSRILATSVRPIPATKQKDSSLDNPIHTSAHDDTSTSSTLPTSSAAAPSSTPPSSAQPIASSSSTSAPHFKLETEPQPASEYSSSIPSAANTVVAEESEITKPIDTVDGIEDIGADPTSLKAQLDEQEEAPVILRASKVPSSRLGRLFHYGSLAASLSIGAASESIRRTTGGNKSGGSVFMSDANIRRLVATLGRMRGAALKLGQFMSIQDNHMLPPEIEKVLHQVQAHANHMPDWQMERVMREEFGSDWQSLFSSFDRTPIASASIGQVHRATLASDGTTVAVKIQFPGVASSIESDLNNLSLLLRSSALLPKGLYLQNTIAVMRRELQDECDYVKEAAAGRKFGQLLQKDHYFSVPKVVEEATTGRVLTTQWMDGRPLSRVKGLSQEARDRIGTNILRLCLMELFQFRFMQTDPNWANFLYSDTNNGSGQESIQLIDFGASREYTKEFMDGWYRLLKSCLENDRQNMKEESLSLGYLTGEENDLMVEAHLDSMALVASPFSYSGKYEFDKQTITDSVRALIPIMLKHRLTPPPQETYSLNRKLSGAFLMCAKLGSNVDCQKLWKEVVGNYKQG